jgi:hypothetical protein
MKKISTYLLLSGFLGILCISFYSGINLSRIIPLKSFFSFFNYLFLSGMICRLAIFGTGNKTKLFSYSLFFSSMLIWLTNLIGLVSYESSLKFQIALLMISFITMISSLFKGFIKLTLLSSILFPLLILIGINNKTTILIGTIYMIVTFSISLVKFLITENKKKAL